MPIDPDRDIYLITEEFPDSIKVLAKDGQDRILDDYILLPEVVELPWLAGLSSRKKENAVTDENIFQYGRLLERIEYLESVEDTDFSFGDAEEILATFRLLKDAFHEWFFQRNIDLLNVTRFVECVRTDYLNVTRLAESQHLHLMRKSQISKIDDCRGFHTATFVLPSSKRNRLHRIK